MNRISLDSTSYKTLPISVNGKDFDIKINTKDVSLSNFIIDILASVKNIQDSLAKAGETQSLEEIVKLSRHAVDKANEWNTAFCERFPEIREAIGDKPIYDFTIWQNLCTGIMELLSETEAKDKITKQIEEEESGALEA